MLFLAALLAVAIGVTLGLLGGGGSTLTLPLLVYVLRVDPRAAIATSLVVVGVTSVVALVPHLRARRVQWSTGAIVGVFGMLGASLGARVAHHVPAALLLSGFALVMVATSARMLRPSAPKPPRTAGLATRAAIGIGVGAFSGLFGAGGGFLIVPALVTFAGLAMREAIATSLLVIAMQALAGSLTHASHVAFDPRLVATIAFATSVGAIVGARASARVEADSLRRGFGILTLITGSAMFLKELPLSVLHRPETPLVALALVAIALALFVGRARATH